MRVESLARNVNSDVIIVTALNGGVLPRAVFRGNPRRAPRVNGTTEDQTVGTEESSPPPTQTNPRLERDLQISISKGILGGVETSYWLCSVEWIHPIGSLVCSGYILLAL